MELLGPSLHDHVVRYGPYPLVKVLSLAIQLLSTIEYIHSCHLIHCDITPMNILMGREQQILPSIHLIDYGLARRFPAPDSFNHYPFHAGEPFVGTATFASVNAHRGYTLSRRDDLESLSYVFLYLLAGSLPWQNLKAKTLRLSTQVAGKYKQQDLEHIFRKYPVEFLDFHKYARNLGFYETPNYAYYSSCFHKCLQAHG